MNPPRKKTVVNPWIHLWDLRKAKLLRKGRAAERMSVRDAARKNGEACDDAIPM